MPTRDFDDYLERRAAERTPDEQVVYDAVAAAADKAASRTTWHTLDEALDMLGIDPAAVVRRAEALRDDDDA
jgi:hypothetical protein